MPNEKPYWAPYWRCQCDPPNDKRTGPGLCLTCMRFPHLYTPKPKVTK